METHTKRRRKMEAMGAGFRDLPENAVAEIMSWLPPECLVQCKLVNKSWYTLIESRWFVSKHVENFGSISSPLLFLTGEWMYQWKYSNRHHYITENQLVTSCNYICQENDKKINFNTQLLTSTRRPSVVKADYHTTHCNGIIFQTENNTNKIRIWNPTTRVEFTLLDTISSCFSGSDFKSFASGLGYDAINKVYKVVRVVSLPPNDGKNSCFGAEICTLDSNPCWREIRMINVGNRFRTYTGNGVYHIGLLYWLLCHEKIGSPDERIMISFEMHSEQFRIVPLLSDVVNKPMEFDSISAVSVDEYRVTRVNMGLWLGLWNERPTLLKYVNETIPWEAQGISKPVEMWTMKKEEEERCCWVKHANFLPSVKRFQPRGFWKTDELLLSTIKKDHFVSYNLRTRKIRTLQLSSRTPFLFINAFCYVKSLVSFDYSS